MADRVQFPLGRWTKGLSLGHSCQVGLFPVLKACEARRLWRESTSKMDRIVFYDLIQEVAPCHFCCLLVRTKSWHSAHPWREGVPRGHKHQGPDSAGPLQSLPTVGVWTPSHQANPSLSEEVAWVTHVSSTCGSLWAVFSCPALC